MASKEIPLAKDLDPVEILFEDEWLVAVQKPPFIITAPKHRFLGGTLFSRVYGYLGKAPFGLHRLDMNTSGCVVFAKDAASAETVNAQFRNKTVQKAYLAICLGTPKDHEFVVETHMDGDPSHETAQKVTENEGKWSKTSFKVLDSNSKIDLTKDSIVQGSKFDSTSLTNGKTQFFNAKERTCRCLSAFVSPVDGTNASDSVTLFSQRALHYRRRYLRNSGRGSFIVFTAGQ